MLDQFNWYFVVVPVIVGVVMILIGSWIGNSPERRRRSLDRAERRFGQACDRWRAELRRDKNRSRP